jgi:hypothetical protein
MRHYAALERLFVERLGLERRPIAIAFCDSAPSGVEAFTGVEPAGCGFWRLAARGQTFYTRPEDHYNCPIGSYTHNMPLPPERQPQLEQALGRRGGVERLHWQSMRRCRAKTVFRVAAEVDTIALANARLAEYHRGRLESLRSD